VLKASRFVRGARQIAGELGPGVISGFSDNDPTTVATLAVIGGSTVYGLAWLVVLVIPMLAIVQSIAARVGAVSKRGLEDCIRKRYGNAAALSTLFAILAVNVLTLGADIGGGAAALHLLTGVSYRWWIAPLALLCGLLLVIARYSAIENVLKYLSLVFVAYAIAAFLAHPDWMEVLRATLVPHFVWNNDYVDGAIALLGTTLTSYAYVWESIETSEERPPLRRLGLVQAEAATGIVLAGISFWFIVIATGATLGVHGHRVETAEDAATALAPVAGRYSSVVFGFGLLGSAMLAVPVLAGTSAYVMAEAFGWRRSLDRTFAQAPAFYGALVASLAAGTAIAYAGISPIGLLFWSGIAGGLATPLTLGFLVAVARDPKIMKTHRITGTLAAAGWAVTGVVVLAAVAFLYRTVTNAG